MTYKGLATEMPSLMEALMLIRFDLCINGNHREPDYQIMVFCTSVEGATNPPALMEFPHVCEIKISGRVLEAVSSRPGKTLDRFLDMIILASGD